MTLPSKASSRMLWDGTVEVYVDAAVKMEKSDSAHWQKSIKHLKKSSISGSLRTDRQISAGTDWTLYGRRMWRLEVVQSCIRSRNGYWVRQILGSARCWMMRNRKWWLIRRKVETSIIFKQFSTTVTVKCDKERQDLVTVVNWLTRNLPHVEREQRLQYNTPTYFLIISQWRYYRIDYHRFKTKVKKHGAGITSNSNP